MTKCESPSGMRQRLRKPLALSKNLVQDNVPVEIIEGIYLGSVHSAFNIEKLHEIGITHVVNCAGIPATFPESFTYMNIKIRDREHANLLSCLPAASVFIQSVLEEGGKAFVHCSFGRSRSPSVTVSYLMKFKSFTFEEAMQLVKARRPVVSLNAGFLEQLRMYELSGFNIHHAQQLLLRKRLREFQVSLRSKDEDAAFEEASFCLGQSKNKLATSKIYQPVLVQVQYSKSCGTVMEEVPLWSRLDTPVLCNECSCYLFPLGSVLSTSDSKLQATPEALTLKCASPTERRINATASKHAAVIIPPTPTSTRNKGKVKAFDFPDLNVNVKGTSSRRKLSNLRISPSSSRLDVPSDNPGPDDMEICVNPHTTENDSPSEGYSTPSSRVSTREGSRLRRSSTCSSAHSDATIDGGSLHRDPEESTAQELTIATCRAIAGFVTTSDDIVELLNSKSATTSSSSSSPISSYIQQVLAQDTKSWADISMDKLYVEPINWMVNGIADLNLEQPTRQAISCPGCHTAVGEVDYANLSGEADRTQQAFTINVKAVSFTQHGHQAVAE